MKYVWIFIFLLPLTLKAEEYTPVPIDGVSMECFNEAEPEPWSYCIHLDEHSKNQDLLYYFHARRGNATWWNDKTYHTGKLYEIWRRDGKEPPMVVSISFGKLWLLTEDRANPRESRYDIFLKHVMPRVEKRLERTIKRRFLAGISMGGVNSLMVGLKTPNTFQKVASVCPPLPTVSPHAGIMDYLDYISKSSVSWKRAAMLYLFSRKFFATESLWEDNDLVAVSAKYDGTSDGTEFYLTCGAKDEWGCMLGSQEIAQNISENSGNMEWVPRDGGHCDIDHESLAAFLRN